MRRKWGGGNSFLPLLMVNRRVKKPLGETRRKLVKRRYKWDLGAEKKLRVRNGWRRGGVKYTRFIYDIGDDFHREV